MQRMVAAGVLFGLEDLFNCAQALSCATACPSRRQKKGCVGFGDFHKAPRQPRVQGCLSVAAAPARAALAASQAG